MSYAVDYIVSAIIHVIVDIENTLEIELYCAAMNYNKCILLPIFSGFLETFSQKKTNKNVEYIKQNKLSYSFFGKLNELNFRRAYHRNIVVVKYSGKHLLSTVHDDALSWFCRSRFINSVFRAVCAIKMKTIR